mgnify:CR=1 FL=1
MSKRYSFENQNKTREKLLKERIFTTSTPLQDKQSLINFETLKLLLKTKASPLGSEEIFIQI